MQFSFRKKNNCILLLVIGLHINKHNMAIPHVFTKRLGYFGKNICLYAVFGKQLTSYGLGNKLNALFFLLKTRTVPNIFNVCRILFIKTCGTRSERRISITKFAPIARRVDFIKLGVPHKV